MSTVGGLLTYSLTTLFSDRAPSVGRDLHGDNVLDRDPNKRPYPNGSLLIDRDVSWEERLLFFVSVTD